MISVFNLSKLQYFLEDFYKLAHIRITVFDDSFRELAAYPQALPPFCQLVRTDAKGKQECLLCDKRACETAARRHALYTYRCHAGLTESITPLYMGNILIGYLLFGHVFSYPSHNAGWAEIQELCKNYQLTTDALRSACLAMPLVSEDYISSASHILQAVASYLCMERMVTLGQQELPVQIDEYLLAHFAENITAADICRHFQIGKTQLYALAKQSYGVGIAEQIRKLRIEKAKKTLTDCPEKSLKEISAECGFGDYNYFITVFKKVTGLPPKQYLQKAKR